MDNVPQLGTASDIEIRAARVADPALGQLFVLSQVHAFIQ